jgi:hypothetical protein
MTGLAGLLLVVFLAGCTATQNRFCNLVDNDSYFLVSVARCETLQVSFEQGEDIRFSALRTFAWLPSQKPVTDGHESGGEGDIQTWVVDAVDAKLAQQGFERNDSMPDFLVSFDAPVDKPGELMLEFTLADNRFAWRGTAYDSGYPARDAEAREQRTRIAVGRLLEEFPPAVGE